MDSWQYFNRLQQAQAQAQASAQPEAQSFQPAGFQAGVQNLQHLLQVCRARVSHIINQRDVCPMRCNSSMAKLYHMQALIVCVPVFIL